MVESSEVLLKPEELNMNLLRHCTQAQQGSGTDEAKSILYHRANATSQERPPPFFFYCDTIDIDSVFYFL